MGESPSKQVYTTTTCSLSILNIFTQIKFCALFICISFHTQDHSEGGCVKPFFFDSQRHQIMSVQPATTTTTTTLKILVFFSLSLCVVCVVCVVCVQIMNVHSKEEKNVNGTTITTVSVPSVSFCFVFFYFFHFNYSYFMIYRLSVRNVGLCVIPCV